MIHVGDKVKIATTGAMYSGYVGFLDYYRECAGSDMVERICSQYHLENSPTDAEVRDKVFTVMFIRAHGSLDNRTLAVINDGSVTYIIDVCALTVVSSDIPFVEGDKVFIKDTGPVYSMWKELVKHMTTVIPDGAGVFLKWTYDHSPASNEVGGESPDSMFTVKWIGHHIARPDEAIVAIISNNRHSYIIGIKGLVRAGEKKWDKYIIYVRNWAVVNKENAQSVRDATGPKSYAEWLSDRNKS